MQLGLFYSLFIGNLLDFEFCGNSTNCIPCPKLGTCNKKDLVCKAPYIRIRYECTKLDTLPYFTQELSIKAEKYLAKRAFLLQKFAITEAELLNDLFADHIVYYQFLEMVKRNHSVLRR